MVKKLERSPIDSWQGQNIPRGESRDVTLALSESYTGITVRIPIHIRRGEHDGPVVFVTAALHGDEINGAGAVRQLIQDESLALRRGAVILAPVLNLLAFERHSRYLPDRRDLNRCFPGAAKGSLASRMARTIFDEIVGRADFGIDLHTAAVRRTNFPNVRADLSDPQVARIAKAFGCEILVDGKGPKRAFRREACAAGCPTIVMEGGEVWKVEPGVVESAVRGVLNVLLALEMLEGEPQLPNCQLCISRSKWIRAEKGGFLQFHIRPGDIVARDQPLATCTTLLGRERSVRLAPFDAVVIGMTTLPAVSPGEPICHLGELPHASSPSEFRRLRREDPGLEERLVEQLASNILVVDPPEA